MTTPELDEATRARIRAEEAERVRVREELAAQEQQRTRPAYWTGAVLNLLVTGAGLMSIGRVPAGLLWLTGAVGLAFLTSPLIAWPLGVIGSFWHYDAEYGRIYATPEEQAEHARQGRYTGPLLLLVLFLTVAAFMLIVQP